RDSRLLHLIMMWSYSPSSFSMCSATGVTLSYLYSLSLHDALPIFGACAGCGGGAGADGAGRLGCAAARLLRAQARGSVAGSPSEIGRAHVWTPVTFRSRMPSSA